MDFVHGNLLDLLHVIVIIDVRIPSVEWGQVRGDPILRVIRFHKVDILHVVLVDASGLLSYHKVFLPEDLAGGEPDLVLEFPADSA